MPPPVTTNVSVLHVHAAAFRSIFQRCLPYSKSPVEQRLLVHSSVDSMIPACDAIHTLSALRAPFVLVEQLDEGAALLLRRQGHHAGLPGIPVAEHQHGGAVHAHVHVRPQPQLPIFTAVHLPRRNLQHPHDCWNVPSTFDSIGTVSSSLQHTHCNHLHHTSMQRD